MILQRHQQCSFLKTKWKEVQVSLSDVAFKGKFTAAFLQNKSYPLGQGFFHFCFSNQIYSTNSKRVPTLDSSCIASCHRIGGDRFSHLMVDSSLQCVPDRCSHRGAGLQLAPPSNYWKVYHHAHQNRHSPTSNESPLRSMELYSVTFIPATWNSLSKFKTVMSSLSFSFSKLNTPNHSSPTRFTTPLPVLSTTISFSKWPS